MTFGFIKVNGTIALIFLNQTNEHIERKLEEFKSLSSGLDLTFEWDNFYSDRQVYELEEFLRTK